MKDINKQIGINAGKIWDILNNNGPQNQSNIIKKTKLQLKDFYSAVGWLARENKISRNGVYYRLGDTNLTEKIGEDAGKIWKALENQGELYVTSIPKIAQIKIQNAYSALGWLARENKIEGKTIGVNSNQIKLKLRY